MTDIATPSLDAYRLWLQGERLRQAVDWDGAIALYREALRLDRGFASAWVSIGIAQAGNGRRDSALASYDRAIGQPGRLTLGQRLEAEARRAIATGEWEANLAAASRWARLQPNDPEALNRYGAALADAGRYEEAFTSYDEAIRRSPFGPTPNLLANKVHCLLDMGRVDEARKLAPFSGGYGPARRVMAELAACDWAVAESLATTQLQAPASTNAISPGVSALHQAIALAGRGALRASAESMVRAADIAAGSSPLIGELAGRGLLYLSNETHGAIRPPAPPQASDHSAAALITRGLSAAAAGDVATAGRLLDELRRRPETEQRSTGQAPQLLEARIAATTGRWPEVVRVLAPVARLRGELGWFGPGIYSTNLQEARSLFADAYQRLGARDSAAVWLERAANAPELWYWGGISRSFAHLRLAQLYASMGRLADAERNLAVLERWWARPDDVARRLLDEARSAVRTARAAGARQAAAR